MYPAVLPCVCGGGGGGVRLYRVLLIFALYIKRGESLFDNLSGLSALANPAIVNSRNSLQLSFWIVGILGKIMINSSK